MARPPSHFRGETIGRVCGHTWASELVVDGRLPDGYGADITKTLDPVMPPPFAGPGGQPDVEPQAQGIGWDSPAEALRRQQLLLRIGELRVATDVAYIAGDIKGAVRWLLDKAEAELESAQKIHSLWKTRGNGAWPLRYADRLTNFYAAENPDDCAGRFGATVSGTGGGTVRCPTRQEVDRREADREKIRERFVDAARFVRCAEYGLYRSVLYRKARLRRKGEVAQGGDVVATPGPGPALPGPIKVPEVPPDFPVPDVRALPPPTSDPLPDDTGPEGATAAPAPAAVSPRRRRRERTAAVIGGVGIALWALSDAYGDRFGRRLFKRAS